MWWPAQTKVCFRKVLCHCSCQCCFYEGILPHSSHRSARSEFDEVRNESSSTRKEFSPTGPEDQPLSSHDCGLRSGPTHTPGALLICLLANQQLVMVCAPPHRSTSTEALAVILGLVLWSADHQALMEKGRSRYRHSCDEWIT